MSQMRTHTRMTVIKSDKNHPRASRNWIGLAQSTKHLSSLPKTFRANWKPQILTQIYHTNSSTKNCQSIWTQIMMAVYPKSILNTEGSPWISKSVNTLHAKQMNGHEPQLAQFNTTSTCHKFHQNPKRFHLPRRSILIRIIPWPKTGLNHFANKLRILWAGVFPWFWWRLWQRKCQINDWNIKFI